MIYKYRKYSTGTVRTYLYHGYQMYITVSRREQKDLL